MLRSLDEFYKYIEKQEQALRERNGEQAKRAPGEPFPDVTTPPSSPRAFGVAAPALPDHPEPLEALVAANPSQRDALADEEQLPLPGHLAAKSGAKAFVPPPLPPKPVRPSLYETIVPATALRLDTRDDVDEATTTKEDRGSASTAPSDTHYVMRGGFTLPADYLQNRLPDIEAYIPALRDPAPEPDLFASPTAPSEPLPTLVADRPTRPGARLKSGSRAISPAAASAATPLSEGEAAALWERLPRHIQLLVGMAEPHQEVAQKYYTRGFKESRRQLIERLLDPTLTLEDTARVLGVCPTTVRRYTNRGVLPHHRTVGQQRRFRLSDVLAFLEQSAQSAAARGASASPSFDADVQTTHANVSA